MRRFDRGGRRRTSNAPQDASSRRAQWKSGGRQGANAGARRGGGAHAGSQANILEKSAATHLKERTGRTLEEWVKLVQETGPATRKERAEWLKTKHGLGVNFAAWIALSADGQLEAHGEGANGNGANGNGNGHADGDDRASGAAGEIDGEDDSEEEQLGL